MKYTYKPLSEKKFQDFLDTFETFCISIKQDIDRMLTRDEFEEFKGEINKKFATKEDFKYFATKEDLKRFATKDDLKRFATKEDLKHFATKEDFKRFATKDDLKNFPTREDMIYFSTKDDLEQYAKKEDIIGFKDEILRSNDRIISILLHREPEDAAVLSRLDNHEERIQKLEGVSPS